MQYRNNKLKRAARISRSKKVLTGGDALKA